MANRTVKDAKSIRGTNPQYLIEKIIRTRIYDSKYWKEECFALSSELLVDKAMSLRFVGGIYGGNMKATPFLCLTLKMLQIQPEKDIIVEFIKNEEFKYVRALGAFYMRLVGTSVDCYKYLEPLLADSRKLRRQNREGKFELIRMDEFIDELLREERVYDVILPRIQKRHVLEENNEIDAKVSALDDDLEEAISSSEEEEEETDHRNWQRPVERHKSPVRERSPRNRSPYHYERKGKDRERDREKERERREREREKERMREKVNRERNREHREKDRKHHDKRDRERDKDRHEKDRRHKDYRR